MYAPWLRSSEPVLPGLTLHARPLRGAGAVVRESALPAPRHRRNRALLPAGGGVTATDLSTRGGIRSALALAQLPTIATRRPV